MREVTHDERRAEEIRIFLTNRGLGNQQATIWAEELSRTIRATYDAAGFVLVPRAVLEGIRDGIDAEHRPGAFAVNFPDAAALLAATGGDDAE